MTDKELKDWCKTCNVEPPAMRFKCPECENNPDKEQIMINGVDVGGCRFYQIKANKLYPKAQYCGSMRNIFCEDNPNCYFKQLARKTQECEELKEKYLNLKEQNGSFIVQLNTVNERLDQLKAENEELKKQLMQKSEVDIFFNTPIEGWSSDPCGICKYKNCLTEIKEIAEPFCNACQEFEPKKNDSNCMYCNYGKILQKISECEVNND